MARFARFSLLLTLALSGCASTVVSAGPDATPDVPDATTPDAAPDGPSPDVAPDVDSGPSFPCAPVVLASGFSLLEGMYGTGRVVFDPSRGTALLVSFSTGAVVRVAADGALTRLAPIRYPNDIARAAVFVDAAADALVVLPLPDEPAAATRVLTLALARPDHWETLGVITSASPPSPAYAVAGFDPTGRSLRVVAGESPLAARRAVWDLRFVAGGWGWARRADFVTPRPTEARAATWNAARAGLLVVTAEVGDGPWGLWSVGADASTALPWTLPRDGGTPVVAHDPARRVTWALATTPAGATLTALPDDASGAVRSVTVGDPMRALTPSTGPAWAAFDAAGRRLYVYVDNIAGGRTSFLTALDVDRCLPR